MGPVVYMAFIFIQHVTLFGWYITCISSGCLYACSNCAACFCHSVQASDERRSTAETGASQPRERSTKKAGRGKLSEEEIGKSILASE
jgi:hypothetical protein